MRTLLTSIFLIVSFHLFSQEAYIINPTDGLIIDKDNFHSYITEGNSYNFNGGTNPGNIGIKLYVNGSYRLINCNNCGDWEINQDIYAGTNDIYIESRKDFDTWKASHHRSITFMRPISASDFFLTDYQSEGRIKIEWNKHTRNGTSGFYYRVYRNTTNEANSGDDWTALGEWTQEDIFDDYPPETGVTYYYWVVCASNNFGLHASAFGSSRNIELQTPKLETPTNFIATALSQSEIELSWNASTSATEYKIYTCNDSYIGAETETTYTITGLSPDTYYQYKIKAINSSFDDSNYTACVGATTMPINLPTARTSGTATICEGETTNISIALTGTPPWNITYTDGTKETSVETSDNPYVFSVFTAGAYQVTAISDANYQGTDLGEGATVTVNPLPTANISGTATVCEGETTNISIALTGNSPWNITYTDGTTEKSLETSNNPYIFGVSTAGTYRVTAISDANCEGTDLGESATVTVNPLPTANISGDTTIYNGETAEVLIELTGTAPWNITYTDGTKDTTILENNNNPYVVDASEVGTYKVTAISDQYCIGTNFGSSATVNVVKTSADNIEICEGDTIDISIELTGTAPWNITYTDGTRDTTVKTSKNPYVFSVSKAGIYEVKKISDATNCAGIIFESNITVIVNPLPTITINGNDAICTGEEVIFTAKSTNAGDNPQYQWQINGTNVGTDSVSFTSNSLSEGNQITCELITSGICRNTLASNTIGMSVDSLPTAKFSYKKKTESIIKFTNKSQNATSYNWNFKDGDTSSQETNPTHEYKSKGDYNVVLTASNNCGGNTYTQTIEIDIETSVLNIDTDSFIKILPNPTNGMIMIETENINAQKILVEIANMRGLIIYSNTFNTPIKRQQIDLSKQASGIYLIRIKTGNFFKTTKLIKK